MPQISKTRNPRKGRRRFLKTMALGAGAVALPRGAAMASPPVSTTPPPTPDGDIGFPRQFSKSSLKMLSFPLGGVAAGSIALGGRGQLREWWIFNRPDKGNSPQYAFPAIWARTEGGKPVARVLESRILPPYEGPSGLGADNVPGLPRLASCTFSGAFPIASLTFEDEDLPVRVRLEAFTPFVPLEDDDSGLPIAVLRYYVSNPADTPATASICFSIDNPVGSASTGRADSPTAHGRMNEFREGQHIRGLVMSNPFLAGSSPEAGSFALASIDAGRMSYWRGWPAARWWESPLRFWEDFSEDGELGAEPAPHSAVGALCVQQDLPARGEAEFTFLLAWHFPNRTPARCGWAAPNGHEHDVIGNYYAHRFPDAWAAAEYAANHLPRLEDGTRTFVAALQESTLPGAVKDAASANLSALVVPTSFRTADGSFHGFEGCNPHAGCCFGNCTHVYAYEAAIAHLFPGLSRSLREQQFGFLTDDHGLMDYRELLPYGLARFGIAAADGQMACLMKLYLDWRLSGDTAWLRRLWPTAKRALQFAWIPGGWDPDRNGVMEGAQHNTYDVEFIGPNPLCGVWYLGALRAMEEMAKAVGDSSTAKECQRLFTYGSRWIDDHLFNGQYYIQKIGSIPRDKIAKGLMEGAGPADTEHPTFQVGDGCLVDQLAGQYFAEIAGLGPLLSRDHMLKTLRSIYKYNYKRTLYQHECVERTFALNDEAALVICDYPLGQRPATPFPYFAEVMTGFEYSAAILMLFMGMSDEGIELISNIRRRYDGVRRNAWDEAECGYHYARPMASWAALLALSGFRYDGADKSVTVLPRIHQERFSCFWSAASGWGSFAQSIRRFSVTLTLEISRGKLAVRAITLAQRARGVRSTSAQLDGRPLAHRLRSSAETVTIILREEAVITEGSKLVLAT